MQLSLTTISSRWFGQIVAILTYFLIGALMGWSFSHIVLVIVVCSITREAVIYGVEWLRQRRKKNDHVPPDAP